MSEEAQAELDLNSKYGIEDLADYNSKKKESLGDQVNLIEWNGILLNLSYILPNVALMCTPSSTDFIRRNDERIIADYIHEKHGEHFYLINVHEDTYDFSLFDEKVKYYPYPDHCAPRISLIANIVKDMEKIKKEDPEVTFFIHCKAGRGRSGTVAAAYMTYSKLVPSMDVATYLVNEKRSPTKIGITIPSQYRFLNYYEFLLNNGWPPQKKIIIRKIALSPSLGRPVDVIVINGIPFEEALFKENFEGDQIEISQPLALENEFVIEVEDNGKNIIRAQYHVDFLLQQFNQISKMNNLYMARLTKNEIDGPHHRVHGNKFPENFVLDIYYNYVPLKTESQQK